MPVRATPLHLFDSFDATMALRSDLRSSPDARRVGFGECRVHDPCHVPTPRCSTAPAVRGRKAPTGDGRDDPPKRQGVRTSAHTDAAAEREERDAAADGDTRRTPGMRDATPSLHVCTVCMAAFRATWRGRLPTTQR